MHLSELPADLIVGERRGLKEREMQRITVRVHTMVDRCPLIRPDYSFQSSLTDQHLYTGYIPYGQSYTQVGTTSKGPLVRPNH